MTVLLMENHSAPVISHWIWYRVGARNDPPGKTGIAHWVEHMQFNGCGKFPGSEVYDVIFRNGGELNAYTMQDCTAYYNIMPTNKIGITVELEADRMQNSAFDPKEVESERAVILSEWVDEERSASLRVQRNMQKAAFPGHPYGRDEIGTPEDLHRITRDDLYEHYRTWYAPNNAVISAAGDFETDEMLRLIEASFGSIPPHPVPVQNFVREAPITEQIRFEEQGPQDLTRLRMSWRIPNAADPDFPAVILLCTILAGPLSMSHFNPEEFPNRTSRLYRDLVASGMATDVMGNYTCTIDPHTLDICAEVFPDSDADAVIEAIFEALEQIARQGVPPAEIEKARKQAKAMFAYAAEDMSDQAYWLGYSAMFADPDWYCDFPKHLESVSAEDIRRVAGSFHRNNCIIGVCHSKEE